MTGGQEARQNGPDRIAWTQGPLVRAPGFGPVATYGGATGGLLRDVIWLTRPPHDLARSLRPDLAAQAAVEGRCQWAASQMDSARGLRRSGYVEGFPKTRMQLHSIGIHQGGLRVSEFKPKVLFVSPGGAA